MKLENLKVSFNAKAENGNSVNVNFELGSYELTPEEHSEECKLIEKLLPALNLMLNNLTEDMTKKKEDMTKKN